MGILNFGHSQILTMLTVNHNWNARIVSYPWVICRVGMLYVYDLFFMSWLPDRRKVAIAFIDGVVFYGNRGVDISVKLLDI